MPDVYAVVFDLDDTLYAERDFAYSGFAAVAEAFAERLGRAVDLLPRMKRLFDSPDRARVFNALLAELKVDDDDLVTRMVEVYRSHRPTLRLFPDAEPALAGLYGRCRLGLLTDGRPTTQRAKIKALDIQDRFDVIVVSSELSPGLAKPHPRAFEHVSDCLQTPGNRCTYVADNAAKDFVAPNVLGWKTVQIRRPEGLYGDVPAPPGGAPQRVIETLLDLPGLWTSDPRTGP